MNSNYDSLIWYFSTLYRQIRWFLLLCNMIFEFCMKNRIQRCLTWLSLLTFKLDSISGGPFWAIYPWLDKKFSSGISVWQKTIFASRHTLFSKNKIKLYISTSWWDQLRFCHTIRLCFCIIELQHMSFWYQILEW